MTSPYAADPVSRRSGPPIDAGRLWAGGAATALIAALMAAAGVVVIRGLFGIYILAPEDAGVLGDASTAWYVLGAGAAALTATALLQLLVTFTPRPVRFFGWIMFLGIAIVTVAPFATGWATAAKIAVATLDLIIGVAIGTLVAGTARSAARQANAAAPGTPSDPYRWPPAR